MSRQKNSAIDFPRPVVTEAEVRRFLSLWEGIAAEASRKPQLIYDVRHKGGDQHVAMLTLARETCARLPDVEAKQRCLLSALALVAETELALLAELQTVTESGPQLMIAAQDADLREDAAEKRYDIQPSAQTAAQLLDVTLREIAAQKAKCAALRPLALEFYAPRSPRRVV